MSKGGAKRKRAQASGERSSASTTLPAAPSRADAPPSPALPEPAVAHGVNAVAAAEPSHAPTLVAQADPAAAPSTSLATPAAPPPVDRTEPAAAVTREETAAASPSLAASPATSTPPIPSTRRDFLARATSLLFAGSGIAALGSSAVWLWPARGQQAERLRLGPASAFKRGTVTRIETPPLFVLHDELGLSALSGRCTHLGCVVRRSDDGYRCPCHGARFDAQGEPVAGPVSRALGWLPIGVDPDGVLWVLVDPQAGERLLARAGGEG